MLGLLPDTNALSPASLPDIQLSSIRLPNSEIDAANAC